MAQLSGIVVGAGVKLPVQDESGPQARPKGQEGHVPGAFSRAEGPFGQGTGVGIVVQARPHAGCLREQFDNGNVVPAGQVRGRHHHAGPAVQRTAATDAHAIDVPGLQAVPFHDPVEGLDQVFHGLLTGSGGKAFLVQNVQMSVCAAAIGDRALRPADINPQKMLLIHVVYQLVGFVGPGCPLSFRCGHIG